MSRSFPLISSISTAMGPTGHKTHSALIKKKNLLLSLFLSQYVTDCSRKNHHTTCRPKGRNRSTRISPSLSNSSCIPAAISYAVHSTTNNDIDTTRSYSTISYLHTSTPTSASVSSTTTTSPPSSPSLSSLPSLLSLPSLSSLSSSSVTSSSGTSSITSTTGTFGTTTSYDMNESTADCPMATALPACATSCIHSAAIAIGCAQHYDMHRCQCMNYSELSDKAASCIVGVCGKEKAIEASSVGVSICSACEGVYF